jgi:ATP-binding protein involved in chromosome partitioning
MSGFSCPHCNEMINLFGSGGGEKTALQMGVPFLGKIPFDPRMVTCGDSGACYQDIHAESEVTKAFVRVAEELAKLAQD